MLVELTLVLCTLLWPRSFLSLGVLLGAAPSNRLTGPILTLLFGNYLLLVPLALVLTLDLVGEGECAQYGFALRLGPAVRLLRLRSLYCRVRVRIGVSFCLILQ